MAELEISGNVLFAITIGTMMAMAVALIGSAVYVGYAENLTGYVVIEENESYVQIRVVDDRGVQFVQDRITEGWEIVGTSGTTSSVLTLTRGDD